jgi:hypothetical protein
MCDELLDVQHLHVYGDVRGRGMSFHSNYKASEEQIQTVVINDIL